MAKLHDTQEYTDLDNPFGDDNLTTPFVWAKKREATEKKINKRLSKREHTHRDTESQRLNREELLRVKKRRKEREIELKEREEDRNREQRKKETEHFRIWEKQEDEFHLNQVKTRSDIRLSSNRAKPIDKLANYINLSSSDNVNELQIEDPCKILCGVCVGDLEDLIEDIKVYVRMEEGTNLHFWQDISIIAEEEVTSLKRLENNSNSRAVINAQLSPEVASLFKDKSHSELASLYVQIESSLNKQELDGRAYWETVLRQLRSHMARLRLKERHQEMLNRKLISLKAENSVNKTESELSCDKDVSKTTRDITVHTSSNAMSEQCTDISGISNEDSSFYLYEQGRYSPNLLSLSEVSDEQVISSTQADTGLLIAQSRVMRGELADDKLCSSESDEKMVSRAEQSDFTEGEDFTTEVRIEQQYLWMDKYKPRKPRYFNRVHTGFEWNKYNQTHYDHDNPPPKIVQGYKFNIFYPDLINKTKTPEYFLEPCKDSKEFVILRFRAGPPYEDIAFKVVNREWEYSYKHGFRSQFNCNIFQLWFHYKRNRYRK
ncbi:cactin [Oopsacas minuta]|uniref:Splicing factor Cactin n=1 Tax=Oopsacas minuta TaxID=111878 RepID=A0AAV7JUT1_9METZ|nr:cactin [Oopsacas minuta]